MKLINRIIKRFLDFVLSLLLLIIIFPIFLVICLLIKIESKGKVIFKQQRLGKNGKVFTIYKFRTMVSGAESIGTGIMISGNDNRITKVGKFLRKSSLDEIPQLFNILIGDMSFVGPRPPVTYHPYKFEEYDINQKKRFLVKPGVTGLAQIKVRNSVSWEERIVFDIKYVNHNNIFIDFTIIIRTLLRIFGDKNVYRKTE